MTRIAKEFKWEMSHRLTFHEGPCRNVHGHSYKMRVELYGEPDKHAMVLDYYDVEKIFRPLISSLDHAFLCDKDDKLMIDFLSANGFKYMIMPNYSTAENMVDFFISEVIEQIRAFNNIISVKIRVHETEDTFAEKEVDLKRNQH